MRKTAVVGMVSLLTFGGVVYGFMYMGADIPPPFMLSMVGGGAICMVAFIALYLAEYNPKSRNTNHINGSP
jgi:hypothetical protein